MSALIDENAGSDGPTDSGTEIIFQLVSLLSIDEEGRVQIDQQFQRDTPVTNQELEKLAKIINAQINTAGQQGDSIAEAISSLLSKISAVEGIASSIGKIQLRIDKGVADGQWQGILDEVVTS
ncbi:MAG: hypothetical protein ACC663_08850, partial [Gammaproteobacteria bacterium]